MPQSDLRKVLDGLFDTDWGERAEVRRWGERRPITPMVRKLVFIRDGYACQGCGRTPWGNDERFRSGPLHIDHIVPWSADGSDTTDNLRTLCQDCNMDRGNRVRDSDKPATPIVRMCAPCLAAFEPQHQRWIEKAAESVRFEVYCAKARHIGWAIDGWHVL